jgi:hypothetical protein
VEGQLAGSGCHRNIVAAKDATGSFNQLLETSIVPDFFKVNRQSRSFSGLESFRTIPELHVAESQRRKKFTADSPSPTRFLYIHVALPSHAQCRTVCVSIAMTDEEQEALRT